MWTGEGETQAGLLLASPAGSSGATAMRGTNWKPTPVARVSAERATVTVAKAMMNASRSDLMVLA